MVKSSPTFFFYDLETSGFDPKTQRIMQFAGQRTDMDLKPIGEPVNMLVALGDEVLPDPGAILVTGITPQKTNDEGYSEAEFLKLIHERVLTPGTIILGFNSVRFDDEFMRYTLYRNFYDPYEWQWKDDRSRWDMLDVVRMTRALRPDGITWPFDDNGQPTNRLERLAAANGLDHESAHDALSDVMALIGLARLIRSAQPKLFEYLLARRGKQAANEIVSLDDPQPFVYSSGRYPKEQLHTTVAIPVATGGRSGTVVVYDLRHDPALWAGRSVSELKSIRFADFATRRQPDFMPLPAKELALNRCPAVAPMGVFDTAAQERVGLSIDTVQNHLDALRASDLPAKLHEVFTRTGTEFAKEQDVDARLYDAFLSEHDKVAMSAVRAADRQTIASVTPTFTDPRLAPLLIRYKARNYAGSLGDDERETWEAYRAERIAQDLPGYIKELERLESALKDDGAKRFLLEELRLWAQSIAPAE